MNHTPILILAGNAGSGKDTVADILVKRFGAQKIAQADPLKRFCKKLCGFSDDQLWGPSASRNAPDARLVDERKRGNGLALFELAASCDTVDKSHSGYDPGGLYDNWPWVSEWLKDLGLDESARKPLSAWAFDITADPKAVTPRYFLQSLGSWGRELDPDVWINAALKSARRVLAGNASYLRDEGVFYAPGVFWPLAVITDGRYQNEILAVRMVGGAAYLISRPDQTLGAAAEAAGIKGHSSEAELGCIPPHFYDVLISNDGTLDQLDELIRNLGAEFGYREALSAQGMWNYLHGVRDSQGHASWYRSPRYMKDLLKPGDP